MHFADEPTKPGRPNILDWGPNHCDLSWEPPESDGGAPITHYEIEMFVSNQNSCIGVIRCSFKMGIVMPAGEEHGPLDERKDAVSQRGSDEKRSRAWHHRLFDRGQRIHVQD